MKIPSTQEMHERIAQLLATTRYVPEYTPVDKDGMPIVEPEPDDPDDE